MAAKKARNRAKKSAARRHTATKKPKAGEATAEVTRLSQQAAKELSTGLERAGDTLVDAARRLWLSAQSLVRAPAKRREKPARRGKPTR